MIRLLPGIYLISLTPLCCESWLLGKKYRVVRLLRLCRTLSVPLSRLSCIHRQTISAWSWQTLFVCKQLPANNCLNQDSAHIHTSQAFGQFYSFTNNCLSQNGTHIPARNPEFETTNEANSKHMLQSKAGQPSQKAVASKCMMHDEGTLQERLDT